MKQDTVSQISFQPSTAMEAAVAELREKCPLNQLLGAVSKTDGDPIHCGTAPGRAEMRLRNLGRVEELADQIRELKACQHRLWERATKMENWCKAHPEDPRAAVRWDHIEACDAEYDRLTDEIDRRYQRINEIADGSIAKVPEAEMVMESGA